MGVFFITNPFAFDCPVLCYGYGYGDGIVVGGIMIIIIYYYYGAIILSQIS
jgi:hypothetical protein